MRVVGVETFARAARPVFENFNVIASPYVWMDELWISNWRPFRERKREIVPCRRSPTRFWVGCSREEKLQASVIIIIISDNEKRDQHAPNYLRACESWSHSPPGRPPDPSTDRLTADWLTRWLAHWLTETPPLPPPPPVEPASIVNQEKESSWIWELAGKVAAKVEGEGEGK